MVLKLGPLQKEYSSRAVWMRTFGHFLLIAIPPITALVVTLNVVLSLYWVERVLWWFGIVITGLTIFVVIETHLWRKKIYSKYGWNLNKNK